MVADGAALATARVLWPPELFFTERVSPFTAATWKVWCIQTGAAPTGVMAPTPDCGMVVPFRLAMKFTTNIGFNGAAGVVSFVEAGTYQVAYGVRVPTGSAGPTGTVGYVTIAPSARV